MEKLALADDNSEPFDQFAGRPNTFEFSDYSTQIDSSKITSEKIMTAMKLEKQIGAGPLDDIIDEELEHSAVVREVPRPPIKAQLIEALAAGDPTESRSRTNSLRNGETSKVIQTADLAF